MKYSGIFVLSLFVGCASIFTYRGDECHVVVCGARNFYGSLRLEVADEELPQALRYASGAIPLVARCWLLLGKETVELVDSSAQFCPRTNGGSPPEVAISVVILLDELRLRRSELAATTNGPGDVAWFYQHLQKVMVEPR